MRKLMIFILLVVLTAMSACQKDSSGSVYEKYEAWRKQNVDSLNTALNNPFYTKLIPEWNKQVYVLMHRFTPEQIGKQTPYYTSKVSVKYKGSYCNGTAFDSSFTQLDSLASFRVNGVIQGWTIALQYMSEGDSVRLFVPYELAYGEAGSSNGYGTYSILPYSNLIFDIKLVKIIGLEK